MTQEKTYAEHAYIRRRGRTTRAQARALEAQIDNFRINPEDLVRFGEGKPMGIEIGFGMGHALFEWAVAEPNWRLFGIELYQPGIGALVHRLHSAQIDNVRILEQPAQIVIAAVEAASVDEIRIFFPDPWPKKRHHKRRLIQAEFVAALCRILKPGGVLRIATDWSPYAEWMRECLACEPGLLKQLDHIRAADAPATIDNARQLTNFEKRGERLGHDIHDLVYVRAEVPLEP